MASSHELEDVGPRDRGHEEVTVASRRRHLWRKRWTLGAVGFASLCGLASAARLASTRPQHDPSAYAVRTLSGAHRQFLVGQARVAAHNNSPTPAELDALELPATRGVEWEWFPFDDPELMSSRAMMFFGEEGIVWQPLAQSNFRQLFAFHGLHDGKWVPGLIPGHVRETRAFERLHRVNRSAFEWRDGEVFIAGWGTLDPATLKDLTQGLMSARGKHGKGLAIRKLEDAWRRLDDPDPYDALIPDTLAEEWRNGTYKLPEFPMKGGVRSDAELGGYMSNLWVRLGIKSRDDPTVKDAFANAAGHVHWVADMRNAPEALRPMFYRAGKGYWGDVNDSLVVSDYGFLADRIASDGTVPLDSKTVAKVAQHLSMNVLPQDSVGLLTRETFEQLQVTPTGYRLREAADLDVSIDPNFPSEFKRLPVGFRGTPAGEAPHPVDDAFPLVHLEARSAATAADNSARLPSSRAPDGPVDWARFAQHAGEGGRGLEGSLPRLRERAEQLGVDARIVDDLNRTLPDLGWSAAQTRALYLLPLNDWPSHPLVGRNLAEMPAAERAAALQRYEAAVGRYRTRLNALAEARHDPSVAYQPEWSDGLKEFSDGVNRVYPREVTEQFFSEQLNSNPDTWFRAIVAGEMTRFIAEADLARLMTIP